MTKRPGEAIEQVGPFTRAGWRRWLQKHHGRDASAWLILEKGAPFTQTEAVEEALCFGWIDSLPRKIDTARWMLLFAPRRKGSPWSRVNKARVAALIATKRMTAAGLALIEAAKVDGSWDSYEAAEALEEPADLVVALAAAPGAKACWDAFAPSSRKGILWWIASAKIAATRAKRLEDTARLAAIGLRASFPESRGR